MSGGKNIGAFLVLAATFMFLVMSPFIVADLYYANNDETCVNLPIANTNISFTLSTWLKVDGYCMLGLVALLFTIGLLTCLSRKCAILIIVFSIISGLYGTFRLAWLIIGAVMFWGYLQPNQLCAWQLNRYMWALLIIGFILVCINCLSSRQISTKKSNEEEFKAESAHEIAAS